MPVPPVENDPYLQRTEVEGRVRIRPEVCRNVPENTPEERRLDESSHAFTEGVPGDVRITTRIDVADPDGWEPERDDS